ncbi:hypothetical protein niasHT_002381 [Heterodera trifolii]|uniref:B30.2/SPRY domain-containing protein n=1 Tax=Heterodera trifolii TaxID=157864 RepID=A0ABD2LM42_9BILA
MSISTNSINCGDDFTPAAENGEVNGDAISLDNDGQFDSESIADQQQLKEFREKIAKMEMELKMAKLEVENVKKMAKLELENEMMVEQKTLKEKVAKIEQEQEKNAIAVDQLTKMLEKFSEMEKQQKEHTKENSDQLSKMQNNQKITLEKISELEIEQKQRKALLNFQQNYWDANFCHENLKIIGEKSLTFLYTGNDYGCYSPVFAKHPILLNNNSSNIFYYEISVKKMKSFMSFGFAVKQQTKLEEIRNKKGTYAYESDGDIRVNGKGKGINAKYSYDVGDTVGIGVHFITRKLFFTKNGLRLDFSDIFSAPSFAADSFHPFVSLWEFGNKIEADFGPNFEFDLSTL